MGRGLVVGMILALVAVGVFVGSAALQYRTSTPGSDPGPQAGMTSGKESRIRVEVLNGGGVPGVAGSATDVLRDRGFDVVYFGNAKEFGRDSSVVYDRVGRLEGARGVADVLGIRNVLSEPDSNLYVDVSVVLGSTWTPVADPADDSVPDARPWWDPLRWIGR